jgi:hypothetical protein
MNRSRLLFCFALFAVFFGGYFVGVGVSKKQTHLVAPAHDAMGRVCGYYTYYLDRSGNKIMDGDEIKYTKMAS